VGVQLTGAASAAAIRLIGRWWKEADAFDPDQVTSPAADGEIAAADKQGLPTLWESNEDPGEPDTGDALRFGDWDYFVEQYRDLAAHYVGVQRLWPNQPLYFEVDAFLNFLYRHQKGLV